MITNNGGTYKDEFTGETVTVVINENCTFSGYPKEGKNVNFNTYDSMGLKEEGLDGNTHYYSDSNGKWIKREKPLTIAQVIKKELGL
jgi:hypothetical protein